MRPAFQQIAPGRLVVRDGGGCMSVFGLPFFCAGVFALLIAVGAVPMQNARSAPLYMTPLMLVMGTVFETLTQPGDASRQVRRDRLPAPLQPLHPRQAHKQSGA